MSNRNTIQSKSNRRIDRFDNKACRRASRAPVSDLPNETSAEMLCDPKGKLSGPVRRALTAGRASIIEIETTEATPGPVKAFNTLAQLPLRKVARRRIQGLRRARKLSNLAAKAVSPTFKKTFAAGAARCIAFSQQADAELRARLLHATNKLEQPTN